MEARRLEEEAEPDLKPLRRGWCLGSEEFRQKMLELMEGKLGENHSGQLHRETAEQKGHRVIAEELARLGWQESDLASCRKADPDKLAIAVRLRNETTLSIKWIAARVRIGSSKGAKAVLHRWVHGQDKITAVQPKACAQLEFESTADPFPRWSGLRLVGSWARPRTWLPGYSLKRRKPKPVEKLCSDSAMMPVGRRST